MKNKIKMFLVKSYFSFKGFVIKNKLRSKNLTLIKEKNTNDGLILVTYKPLRNRLFKINTQCCEKTSGVTIFNENTQEIKYWTLGVLIYYNELRISKWKNF